MRVELSAFVRFGEKLQGFLVRLLALLVVLIFSTQFRAVAAPGLEGDTQGPLTAPAPGKLVAQSGQSGESQYTPKTGEQPDYSKKYYPTEVSNSFFLELNPLLLLNRGLALETEVKVFESFTLGADLLYRDATIFESDEGVKGRLTYFGAAPKMRFYPLPTMSGVFFGVKVFVGRVSSEISGNQGSEEFSQMMVSPVAHVGYRISSLMGATLALYLGGGMNIPELKIDSEKFPAGAREDATWEDAASQLRQAESAFRPDFGLTLGIAF